MQRYSRFFSNGLFGSKLIDQMDQNDPLIILYHTIDWDTLCLNIGKFYDPYIGRPSTDLKLLISLLMLQKIFNLSDQAIIYTWKQNYCFQAFSGRLYLTNQTPCNSSTLCNFRKKIGKEGLELIFAETVRIHSSECLESKVILDTTVQKKNISFPTDTKLRLDVISQCWAISSHLGITFDEDYHDEVAILKKTINLSKSTRSDESKKNVEEAKDRTKDIANDLLDQLEAKALSQTKNDPLFVESMTNYRKAVNQTRHDKDKIYSIYEPHVACIAKGKASVKYEFGNKVSIAIGCEHKLILGVASLQGAPYDGDTIEPTLEMMQRVHNGYMPELGIGDLGYRGRPEVMGVKILNPSDLPKSSDPLEREGIRLNLISRSSVEPIIGHMKADHGLNLNLLHGISGDHVNALSAAIGFNLKRFLNIKGAETLAAVCCFKKKRSPKSKTRKVPFIRPKVSKPSILPKVA
ncbi:MAG: IS5 family transposase [Christensenellaceae bacterium]|jgi:IS5 family transposase|nr:IS5 family transposase [Christensenellaceae bacterium]